MPPDPRPKPSRRSCLATLAAVILAGSLAAVWVWAQVLDFALESGTLAIGQGIFISIKTWANDHSGRHPDSILGEKATSNMAFRELFKSDIMLVERVFSTVRSPFVPDGEIGSAPDYAKALEPGENHWMLVAGLSNESPGRTPLFFENALDTSWPPKWRPGFFMPHVRGRSWRGKKIVVGFNDGNIRLVPLKKQGDYLTLPDDVLQGLPPMKVLDIEEKP
jgi:hypothetical protein